MRYAIFAAMPLMLLSLLKTDATPQVVYSDGAKYAGSIGRPVMGPDGRSFYADINVYDPATGGKIDTVLEFSLEGEKLGSALSHTPYFSPDGKYSAFNGEHDGKTGLWAYEMATGKYLFLAPVHASNAFLGHRTRKNFIWSPDSRFIAYLSAEREPEGHPDEIQVYSRILFKSRTSFSDNLNTHIYIVPVAGGAPRQLTTGAYDEHSITWSPDGAHIAFISNRTEDPDDNHNNDLWTVNVETGVVARLTETQGPEFYPVWSPDGRYIAYLGATRAINTTDSPAENDQLKIIPAEGGDFITLTEPLDRRIVDVMWNDSGQFSNIQWSGDGRYIYFMAEDSGCNHIWRADVENGALQSIIRGRIRVGGFALSPGGDAIIYTAPSHLTPGELWAANPDGTGQHQLTQYQNTFHEKVVISVMEPFFFRSIDGVTVQGWLMKPNPYDPGRKYPLILQIHGGPHGSYGYTIHPTWQKQAESGYAVVLINPRGSNGYGQAFLDGTINNWGGGDYQDIMAGLDFVLGRNPWIDGDRMGVTGGSYGGYMTNWVITQTNRFKAAVSYAGLSNLISFYGTSLYQLLIETEFPGNLWDNFDLLWHWSPLAHVANCTTPTLFVHGVNDHDVPIEQAEEMYIALKKLGVESEYVRYPGEGHGFRKYGEDRERRTLEWMNKYLHPEKIVRR